jgi:hypothetical protein
MVRTLLTLSLSPFPQYWAPNTLNPYTNPFGKRKYTNATCPASDTAESEVWSRNPNIKASDALTKEYIRYCSEIGMTNFSNLV